jgi:hypothetical protein
VSAIANPLAGKRLMLARVAGGRRGEWHVILVSREDTLDVSEEAFAYTDSATIWHGVLDSALRWRGFAPISVVRQAAAWLAPEFASDIAVSGHARAILGRPLASRLMPMAAGS